MTIVRRVPRLPTSSWPGFVPAIHVLPVGPPEKDVDARNVGVASPAHDDCGKSIWSQSCILPATHAREMRGDRRNIIRSDDGRASGSRSLIPDETQSGFASGVKTSDPSQQHRRKDIIGIHMKKIILATVLAALGSTSALAADLGARAPYAKAPAMVDHVYNWTGFYIGVSAGYGFMKDDAVLAFPGATPSRHHFLATDIPTRSGWIPASALSAAASSATTGRCRSSVLGRTEFSEAPDISYNDMKLMIAAQGLGNRVMTATKSSTGLVRSARDWVFSYGSFAGLWDGRACLRAWQPVNRR